VLLALPAAGCAPERDFMPLAVGNRWDYRVVDSDGTISARRLSITGRAAQLTWRARDGGALGLWSGDVPCAWSKEDNIVSVQQEGARIYLLWLPPAVGTGWWTQTPDGARVWCQIVGRETVRVPAGTFPDCVVVVMEEPGGRTEMRHWFAPGVGWVRYSWGPRGGRPFLVRELVAWELRPLDKYQGKESGDRPKKSADQDKDW